MNTYTIFVPDVFAKKKKLTENHQKSSSEKLKRHSLGNFHSTNQFIDYLSTTFQTVKPRVKGTGRLFPQKNTESLF